MNKYSQLVVDTFVRVKSHVLLQNTIKTTYTVQTSQIKKPKHVSLLLLILQKPGLKTPDIQYLINVVFV